jgi:carbohydrate-selective porin OprB
MTARRARSAALRRVLVLLAACAGTAAAAPTGDQAPPLERQYLTGEWDGIRPLLVANGFRPYLTYTGSLWSNLAGGNATGVRVNGYLDFGFEVDLEKLGAWDGLGFHADFHWWQGSRPTQRLIGGLLAQALSDWEAATWLLVVQPDAQFFFNPPFSRRDAQAIGMQVVAIF